MKRSAGVYRRAFGTLFALSTMNVVPNALVASSSNNTLLFLRLQPPLLLLGAWLWLLMLLVSDNAYEEGQKTIDEVLRNSYGKLWRFVGNALLLGIAVGLGVLVAGVSLAALLATKTMLGLLIGVGLLAVSTVVGVLCLVRVGIYEVVIALEAKQPGSPAALARSWGLMKHHVWRGLLPLVLPWVCVVPGAALTLFSFKYIGTTEGASWPLYWSGQLVGALAGPLFATVPISLYKAIQAET